MISNLGKYIDEVREKSASMTQKNRTIPDDASNFTFTGKTAHEVHLNSIFNFIEFIILQSNQKVNLGTANIDNLWFLFVQQPVLNQDQTLFLRWVNRNREVIVVNDQHQREVHETFLFNDEEKRHFFTRILCNSTYVDFQKISIGQVKSFHKFFKVINEQEQNIRVYGKRINVTKHD
jgi:hypothetical protein